MHPLRSRVVLVLMLVASGQRAPAADPSGETPVSLFSGSLLVQLRVADLERSIRFYTETLGFRVSERREDLQFAHVDCGVPGLQLGLAAGSAKPAEPGSIALNFSVADVESGRKALEARGVVFTGPTHVIPGKVRLAEFLDPDGYRLRLAGPDRTPE